MVKIYKCTHIDMFLKKTRRRTNQTQRRADAHKEQEKRAPNPELKPINITMPMVLLLYLVTCKLDNL